jgi:predicted transcriptional regulator
MSIAAKQPLRDAMQRLSFLAKVARGLEAADRGEVLEHEAARRESLGDSEAAGEA